MEMSINVNVKINFEIVNVNIIVLIALTGLLFPNIILYVVSVLCVRA